MKPNWKDAPAAAHWLAQDESGRWYFYQCRPIIGAAMQWINVFGSGVRLTWLHKESEYVPNPVNWRTTLEERPKEKDGFFPLLITLVSSIGPVGKPRVIKHLHELPVKIMFEILETNYVEPPKVPRECWVRREKDTSLDDPWRYSYATKEQAERGDIRREGTEVIHMREVLE